MLRVYATHSNIELALSKLRSAKQKLIEDKETYCLRLMTLNSRCGASRTQPHLFPEFINGFDVKIRYLLLRDRQKKQLNDLFNLLGNAKLNGQGNRETHPKLKQDLSRSYLSAV